MKLQVLSQHLQKKLTFASHAVSAKSQLPILLNFLLVVKDGALTINATDLEIGIIINIPANIEEEGEITVPAKLFLELVNSVTAEKIQLETKEKSLYVQSGKTSSIFQTIEAVEFPKLMEQKGSKQAVFEKNVIEKEFGKVIFAASIDAGRPALSGVLLKTADPSKQQGMLLVATDGYRLSMKNITTDKKTPAAMEKAIIIPSRIMRELLSAKEEGSTVELYISPENNQVLFSQDDMMLVGRLIEAEFPNYQKIIPSEFATQVVFDKEEMLKAVKVSAIFAREAANIVKFTIQKNKIVVSANSPSVGQNTVEVEAKVSGEENEIAFNVRYLLDLFSNVEDETMVFEMTGPLNPGVFKIQNDTSFLHIIMPIRVQG